MSYLAVNEQAAVNPLRSTSPLLSQEGRNDTLLRCSSTLSMLADLFGGTDSKHCGYELLATPKARYGVWSQLTAMADMLEYLADHPVAEHTEALLFLDANKDEAEALDSLAASGKNWAVREILRRSGFDLLATETQERLRRGAVKTESC